LSFSAAVFPGFIHALANSAISSSHPSLKTSSCLGGCQESRLDSSSTPRSRQRNSDTNAPSSSSPVARFSLSQVLKQGVTRWPASPKKTASEFNGLLQEAQLHVVSEQPAPFLEHLHRDVLHPVVQRQLISSSFTDSRSSWTVSQYHGKCRGRAAYLSHGLVLAANVAPFFLIRIKLVGDNHDGHDGRRKEMLRMEKYSSEAGCFIRVS
jgi:hypothetical protein